MIKELARYRCTEDNGTGLFVVELRHVFISQGEAGAPQHRGLAWATLLNGKPVRHVANQTFKLRAKGELLVHDLQRGDLAPAARTASRDGGGHNMAGHA